MGDIETAAALSSSLTAEGLLFVDNLVEAVVPSSLNGHVLDTGQLWSVGLGSGVIDPSGLCTVGAGTLRAKITTPLASSDQAVDLEMVLDGAGINGIILRKTDANNFWLIRYQQNIDTVQIFKKESGGFSLVATKIVTPSTTTLIATALGNTITATYAGQSVSVVSSFNNSAKTVGIRSDAGSQWTKYTASIL